MKMSMNRPVRRVLMLFVSATVAILLHACSGSDKESETSESSRAMTDDSLCITVARKVSSEFAKELKSTLVKAMKEGGAVNAINVCRTMAPEIAAKHTQAGVYSIKRVSDRNRNPDNLADSVELEIMARFADTTGEPQSYISRWVTAQDHGSFVYYAPIRTGQVCMKCHGSPETMEAEVRDILRTNYPEDRATGYQPGDLRGLLVVTIKWPEGKEWAEKLIAEQEK